MIDSVGFNDMTYLDTAEHPHSDQLHLVERYKPIDANHLSYEVTIDDAKAYEKPWKNTRTFVRMKPGSELMEYVCMENNKDLLKQVTSRCRLNRNLASVLRLRPGNSGSRGVCSLEICSRRCTLHAGVPSCKNRQVCTPTHRRPSEYR